MEYWMEVGIKLDSSHDKVLQLSSVWEHNVL